MARKSTTRVSHDNGPVQVMAGIPPPAPPPEPEPELEKSKPVVSWKWSTSRGTVVEVSVWAFETLLEGGECITRYTVTNHRSFRMEDGTWSQKNGHFGLVDLATLMHGLQQAHAWIMSKRDLNGPEF